MILYYAMGGGLGHLTRARAFRHTLGLGEPFVILSASPFAHDRRVVGDCHVIDVPPALATDLPAYRAWLGNLFDRLAPAALYLDVFPAGILGEFCDFPFPAGLPLYHLARLLRWEAYEPQLHGAPPQFQLTYLLEPLAAAHEQFLYTCSRDLLMLPLTDPPQVLPPDVEATLRTLAAGGRPLWLVIHAGFDDEIMQVLAYAEEAAQLEGVAPTLLLIAPRRPAAARPAVVHLDLYPATPLFPLADRIITAAGFNAMRQTLPHAARHRFLPFARRFDDQFARAARRRATVDSPQRRRERAEDAETSRD